MAVSIRAEAAGLAADRADQRRIIAGTPERSNYPLKYSSNQRLWVSLGGWGHDYNHGYRGPQAPVP